MWALVHIRFCPTDWNLVGGSDLLSWDGPSNGKTVMVLIPNCEWGVQVRDDLPLLVPGESDLGARLLVFAQAFIVLNQLVDSLANAVVVSP
jgi:hypothetical protein